ncbi:sensor histidine kinase [Leucobacter aridicollis]|uniref:sensor histidine kinase n=1 Tax=Leucobacter aridicollis TaxID=283878 RepID=UPI002168FC6D|nr:histidine kinase [Leucobacter aridicollis]MCS3428131.1 signal transduction histidine kinase [Leucobacter aridicollis]
MSEAASRDSDAFLPNPPGAIRRWVAAHPRAIDMGILVCYLIGAIPLALLDIFSVFYDQSGANVVATAAYTLVVSLRLAAGTVALILRRRAPLLGLIIVTVALFGDGGPLIIANAVASWFLLYAVPVYRDVRTGWIAYAIAVGGSILGASIPTITTIFGENPQGRGLIGTIVLDAIWSLAVLLIGINLGNRRRYLQAIIDRAHQLARERDQLAQLAVAEERSRIAREIHDIVAHSVSVMIALSEGAARAVEQAPSEAANAMQRSAETGRTALAEMRRLLGALQMSEAADMAPQPSLEDIPGLVRGFEDAGLVVTLDANLTTLHDRLQGLAIFRIVQEGLTNVLRYAGVGAKANVMLRGAPNGIEVVVRDHGRPANTVGPTTGLGSGRGLAGLAERVRVFGGTISSGPVPDGAGWQLRAFFPAGAGTNQSEKG